MRKTILTLLACLVTSVSFATSVFWESFEYANHDLTVPIGWNCDDQSWLCGYLDKDHNRTAHTGDWYAFTTTDDSWMFIETFMSSQIRYHYSYWAISDGTYEVELWAGSGPSAEQMSQLLFTATVHSGNYEEFREYVETINEDYRYLGIHAIASSGAYHLTIDDINIDMVARYDLDVTPMEWDTVLLAGTEITLEYDVANTGYEDLTVTMTPYTEYFENIHFTVDGLAGATFPTVPNQTVHCTCTATLTQNLNQGTRCWMDIMFTVSCDCLTRMITLWVTVDDPDGVAEYESDDTTQQVEVFDLTGKKVDPTCLKPGVYIERTVSAQGVSSRKFNKQ